MVVGPVVLVLAAVLGLGRFDTVGGIITVATIVIALGFAVWVAWRARTVVTYSTVQRSAFGSGGRIHQLADVGEVVLFQRAQSGQAVAPPFLVVRDRAGRRMLAMSSPLWSPADLLALAYALTPQPAVYAAPMRPLDVEARHPGAMRFHEKHPWWTAWIVVGAVVVGATLLVVASFVI
ncbi:hypothetical protein Bcav_3644 [Beutenbergia cavernae DSM 12333]|uniref:Uncharacterized protein n=2 Tax=Beutenbergia TaxID=84756 RepID=C5C342_BEUC1|nr:hypothetical protein Bcav_3644 [Beutenbergia cavernae DSM 12333]